MDIRIQAIPTWQCNYYDHKKGGPHGSKCAYCNLYSVGNKDTHLQLGFQTTKTLPIIRELTPEQWAAGAELVHRTTGKNLLWDFTGGEPTLYAGLAEMLGLVGSYSRWAVTSNTSLRKRIEEIFARNSKCSSWTASWHPLGGMSIDEFIDNLHFIRSHGTYVSITMVLHPSTQHCIKEHLERFQAEKFVCQVHMHEGGCDPISIPAPGGAEAAHAEERIRASLSDTGHSIEHLSRPIADDWARMPHQFPPPNDCISAFESIAISSDGAVFPCYNAMMVESDPPIGRWGTWVPNTEVTRGCTWNCVFGCDLRNILPAVPA